ncbi:hypothetical protein C8J56DRAFT_851443 [Mycena floridula]|nr:hypothetical protein C8J56DRAFT_851443 [Mycena floridula]
MSSPTELHLPPTFPYPIKVTSIDARLSSEVERGTRLLSYSFVHLVHGSPPETRFGTWDSSIDGTIHKWTIQAGDTISQRRAKERPVVLIVEPCKHGMQVGGLCVVCGKDMTNIDYTGFSDASRASIQMTHSAFGPTVSLEEAQRIERESAEHLLKSRKLSLIVDLDQTIVHATVDPTVGEWITEGEAWEARQALRASSSKPSLDNDECNPNWEALKDVKKFKLGPESFVPPGHRGSKRKGKNKSVESDGATYYIKPRPGWKEFLQDTATKYELHVYTMGTRAYAEEVCAAIDPDEKIFGGRLLSRDESGSLTQKSLQRLFPCDTSMVVIIDDRADVWEWSPNLLKVIPYDFFIGIGDINSTFLPKIEPLAPPPSTSSEPAPEEPPDDIPATPEEEERTERETKAMFTENSLVLEAQLEERPLAKRQEELEESEDADTSVESALNSLEQAVEAADTMDDNHSTSSKSEKHHRKALLKNDDVELERISKLLDEVHRRFFTAYESRSTETPKLKRRQSVSGKRHHPPNPYDVTRIIPAIRSEVLAGVHILFSSVIPLDTRPESTEIWRMAYMFGATCLTELTSEVTHVVAAKRGTVKVDQARRRGGVKIVWLAWFTESIALWHRQEETPYFLDDQHAVAGPSTSPIVETHSHVPLEPDEGWDLDAPTGGDPTSLVLNEIDWNDINDEVDAAMNESDDDEDAGSDARSERSDMRSGNASDEEMSDESSSPSSPSFNKRKRLRSLTPSENGINGEDVLRSPLSKRKKLVTDRTGNSKLKETFSIAEDVGQGSDDDGASVKVTSSQPSSPRNEEMNTEDDNDTDEAEDEDDFLARELEEELG